MSQIPINSKMVWSWQGKAYSMPITVDDIITLARAIQFEGPPSSSVAWTLIQRAAWLWTNGTQIGLGPLVEQYAQPINPAWFPTGAKHLAEVDRLTKAGDSAGAAAEQKKAQTRVAKANTRWSQLSQATQDLVGRILAGESTSPLTGSVHYWMTRGPTFAINQGVRPTLGLINTGVWSGTNVFFTDKGSESFGGIRIVNGLAAYPGVNLPSSENMELKALACLVGGYIGWRYL
jgi:hypothetical protein